MIFDFFIRVFFAKAGRCVVYEWKFEDLSINNKF
jgi:hypothetical protein